MKRLGTLVISLMQLLCIVSMGGCQKPPMTQAQLDTMLPVLIQGTKDSITNIKSGKGSVTVHEICTEYDDGTPAEYETLGTYAVVFDGAKYKVTGESKVLKNRQHLDTAMNKAGDVLPYAIACDGRRTTVVSDFVHAIGQASGPIQTESTGFLLIETFIMGSHQGDGHGIRAIDFCPPNLAISGIRAVSEQSIDGNQCIVVEQERKGWRTNTFWVDPNRGFCVPLERRWAYMGEGKEPAIWYESHTTLRDYGDGLWGPSKHVIYLYEKDGQGGMRIYHYSETTYSSDYRLNVPIDPADLVYKVPADVRLTNVDKVKP